MPTTAIRTAVAFATLVTSLAAGAPPRYEAILIGGPEGWSPWVEQRGVYLSTNGFLGNLDPVNDLRAIAYAASGSGDWQMLPPLAGYNRSWAAAVGPAGMVIGTSSLVRLHGFRAGAATVWVEGEPTALPTLGGSFSQASDVNSSGLIVGSTETEDRQHSWACSWSEREFAILPVPQGTRYSSAISTSDSGYIAGLILDAVGETRAARWLPSGDIQVLQLAGEHIVNTWAVGINDAGHALVLITDDDPIRTWTGIWSGSEFTPLPPDELFASSINNHDQVVGTSSGVGYYIDADGAYSLDELIDIGPQGPVDPEQIDDRGWIIGSIWNEQGLQRAVLLKPIESRPAAHIQSADWSRMYRCTAIDP